MVLFIAYPSVSQKILRTFRCRQVEGVFYLAADMRLRCFTGQWYGYALYAGIMGALYVVGFPLAIFVILWRRRRTLFGPGSEETARVYGFLYDAYGANAWWWEIEELLRKLCLTALVVLMDPGTPLQVTLAVLFSGWAHVLHAVYKPWLVRANVATGTPELRTTYMVQHGSLFVTSFVFLMGLLFKVEGVSSKSPTYEVLTVIMLLVCVLFVAWWSWEMFSGVCRKCGQKRLTKLRTLRKSLASIATPALGGATATVSTVPSGDREAGGIDQLPESLPLHMVADTSTGETKGGVDGVVHRGVAGDGGDREALSQSVSVSGPTPLARNPLWSIGAREAHSSSHRDVSSAIDSSRFVVVCRVVVRCGAAASAIRVTFVSRVHVCRTLSSPRATLASALPRASCRGCAALHRLSLPAAVLLLLLPVALVNLPTELRQQPRSWMEAEVLRPSCHRLTPCVLTRRRTCCAGSERSLRERMLMQ
jgi:hypothetical protein